MATKILDIELTCLPTAIDGLSAYRRAFVLCRMYGRPLGLVKLPIFTDVIYGSELRQKFLDHFGLKVWQYWIERRFDHDKTDKQNLLPTVVICTRDRVHDLERCLDGLLKMPDDGQEILVIDNNPQTEQTYQLLKLFPTVRYIREDRKGLSCARNRAIREANHPIVAFIDDDAIPDRNWLRSILRNFDDPLTACVTGLTMPLELETTAQEWFERLSSFIKGFTRKVFDSSTHNPLAGGRFGAGVNMALRKQIIEEVGEFDENLGAGTPTQAGEEHEMFARVLNAGYRIVYEPDALNWHRHRRTWDELEKVLHGYGLGVYAYYTRLFLYDKDWRVFAAAWGWLRSDLIPKLITYALRSSKEPPFNPAWVQLRGCFAGPWIFLKSRRENIKKGRRSVK